MSFDYQRPDSSAALNEGLEEYYASRNDLAGGRGMSDAAREFFRCHDAAHVVFGCTTSLLQEGVLKIWSLFGTTKGFALLNDYALPESKEIYQTLSPGSIVRTAVGMLTLAPGVIVRSRQMRMRWPWHDFEQYATAPLVEIRREYTIRSFALGER